MTDNGQETENGATENGATENELPQVLSQAGEANDFWMLRDNRVNALRVVADTYRGIGITPDKAVECAKRLETYLNTGE